MVRNAVYPEVISTLVDQATLRILAEMRQHGPVMAQKAEQWMKSLAGSNRPGDYFQHPLAFPMLLLPWWMERTLRPEPDLAFQAGLIYSSINGYYFIRMIDNVMDGHSSGEQKLLPMLGFFHLQAQAVYPPYFGPEHPFWTVFKVLSVQSAENAIRESGLIEIDLAEFRTVAGKKVVAGKIPLAAVSFRYQQPHLYAVWQAFYDKLGCWHQLYNDLFGWIKDLRNQTPSYFLSTGRRRKRPEQSLAAWVIHEGFAWGVATLTAWLGELQQDAASLRSPALLDYLQTREQLMQDQAARVVRTFDQLDRLVAGDDPNMGKQRLASGSRIGSRLGDDRPRRRRCRTAHHYGNERSSDQE
jgi:hypothetical protein